jgi:hypothetical protein
MDPARRKELIDRMQQIMYEQTPWVVLTYPRFLEAYNDARWTGWVRMLNGTGPAFLTTGYPQSYIAVKPVAAEASGSSNLGLWVAVGVVAVAGAAALVWLQRRRRPRSEED